MRFKVDENLPVEVSHLLRARGHDSTTVREENLGGADDRKLSDRISSERRALLTLDLDFSDIRAYPPGAYAGIIVYRPERPDKPSVVSLTRRLTPRLAEERLEGRLWIVEPDRIRIREPDTDS